MEYMYKDLVEKAKGGCKGSMETLVDRLRPLIYSAIRRYKREMDTEDLYQEACILIIEAIRDFDEARGVPFLAFARSRVYYGIYNIARKDHYEISLDESLWDGDGQSMLDMLEDTGLGVEDEVIKDHLYVNLRRALETLTPKQREVILAHFFGGIKFKDIARDRCVHYKTVLRLKERGIRKLYEELRDEKDY